MHVIGCEPLHTRVLFRSPLCRVPLTARSPSDRLLTLPCCCLVVLAGHAIKLEEVFDVVKEIRINMDGKLDEAIRLAMGKAWPSRSLRSAHGVVWVVSTQVGWKHGGYLAPAMSPSAATQRESSQLWGRFDA
jgi:hypothetical protein